ncbi:hypothetical protein ABK040_006318 [Willaertia magna]
MKNNNNSEKKGTYTTINSACSIIPPLHTWPDMFTDEDPNSVLDYENNKSHWPAHINLAFPFIPLKDFTNAKTKLKQVFKKHNIKPFDIILKDFEYFEHSHTSIIYLKPSVVNHPMGDDLLIYIHKLINETLGIVDKTDQEYVPHLSVAYVQTNHLNRILQEFKERSPGPIQFTVDTLHFLAVRDDNGKMTSKCCIVL